jgi:hypothetical protein
MSTQLWHTYERAPLEEPYEGHVRVTAVQLASREL